jgi:hypothetical protein
MSDVADYAGLVEERREAVTETPPEESSPWSNMALPTLYAHLVGQGETPEVAADIVDGIMVERNGKNGDSHAA